MAVTLTLDDKTYRGLYENWRTLIGTLGLPLAQSRELFFDLLNRYHDRPYHNADHLRQVLVTSRRLRAHAATVTDVYLAAWFHDAIYRPGAEDNEVRSALYARQELAAIGAPQTTIGEVARLVLLTKTHRAGAEDGNACVLLDADLAILGAPAPVYSHYARAIRREYAHIPLAEYRSGRAAALRRFLEREHIYCTPPLSRGWEQRARRNLRRELSALETKN